MVDPFPEPIVLKDGRDIATLEEAAKFMLRLPESAQRAPWWQYAGELVMKAGEHGGYVAEAWAQMGRALARDGFL